MSSPSDEGDTEIGSESERPGLLLLDCVDDADHLDRGGGVRFPVDLQAVVELDERLNGVLRRRTLGLAERLGVRRDRHPGDHARAADRADLTGDRRNDPVGGVLRLQLHERARSDPVHVDAV